MQPVSRRSMMMLAAALSVAGGAYALAQTPSASTAPVPLDPYAPVGGNPKGSLTIVSYVDYNCPFCKKAAPDLERVVREDGDIRLVYKDLPILAESSVYGAQLALAAKQQAKYEVAHHALMKVPGYGVSKERMSKALRDSGIDMARLQADLDKKLPEIMDYLKRNLEQAKALGIRGTPTFIVGPYMASTLDYAQFKEIINKARQN